MWPIFTTRVPGTRLFFWFGSLVLPICFPIYLVRFFRLSSNAYVVLVVSCSMARQRVVYSAYAPIM